MGHIITDLKETFRRGNTFIRLIYINVGIFVIGMKKRFACPRLIGV